MSFKYVSKQLFLFTLFIAFAMTGCAADFDAVDQQPTSDQLSGQVMFEGAPIANADVLIETGDDPDSPYFIVKTGEQGFFSANINDHDVVRVHAAFVHQTKGSLRSTLRKEDLNRDIVLELTDLSSYKEAYASKKGQSWTHFSFSVECQRRKKVWQKACWYANWENGGDAWYITCKWGPWLCDMVGAN